MNSSELYERFRDDVQDKAQPYFWSDTNVWDYMNDAYRMFVRLTGGVADFDSDVCFVDVVAGEATAPHDKSILRFMGGQRKSDNQPIEIINFTDMGKLRASDYGQAKSLLIDSTTGPVKYVVTGMKRNTLRWIQIPEVSDTIQFNVYRLPLNTIDGDNQEFEDVDEDHHLHLLNWMKYMAYNKHDADTYDPVKAESYKKKFEDYCALVRAEWERYKAKTRTVSYGGL